MGLFSKWFKKKDSGAENRRIATKIYATKLMLTFEDNSSMEHEHISMILEKSAMIIDSYLGSTLPPEDDFGSFKGKRIVAVKIIE